jgi:N6-L-threonylcarbamoyladenine synthase
MRAHILAHFIEDPKPAFPFLCLTVSGGHTQLVLVHSPLDMEIIGETLDDAVGEAFDKTAKLIGLPYPGGPLIDQYAKQGNPNAFQFANVQFKDLNFSFSGIKTAVLYFLKEQVAANPSFIQDHLSDICASVQKTLVDLLIRQLDKAVKATGTKHIGIAGGVSANSALREAVKQYGLRSQCHTYIPRFAYCTDNAAMIAMAAHFLYEAGIFEDQGAAPLPRYPFA